MILGRYIAMRFFRSFLLIAGVFLLILLLIDMVEIIRRFASHDIGLTGAAILAGLHITGSFYSILPLVTVLGGIALFLGMARSSEMVAIRASGRSALRVVAAPALAAALIGVLVVGLMNPLVALTGKLYDASVAQIENDGQQVVTLSDNALWLRQALVEEGREVGQVVIRVGRASPDASTLYQTSFLIFDPDSGPIRRIEAEKAVLTPGAWRLSGVKDYALDQPNPEASAQQHDVLELPSDLTASRIREGFGQPNAVPIWQLPAFIAGMERAGFSASRHRVWLQMELARPLLMAAMVLIAAGFTMQHARGRNSGIAVLSAFIAGIGLFFLRNVAQVMGDNGQIVPIMAGWAPPVIGMLLALGLILVREDG